MDDNAFDAVSRAMAGGLRRRQVLARLGAGGLGAALLGAAGLDRARSAPSLAQAATCRLELVATVRLGPSAGALLGGNEPGKLRGALRFALAAGGAIDQGRLELEDGTELGVVGQATGRAVNLRVAAGDGQTLVLVGTAEQGLDRCAGAVDGLLTGPQSGDLGDWHATATALRVVGADPAATTAPATARPVTATATAATSPTATAPATATGTPASEPTAPATPEPAATSEPTAPATPEPTATATATAEPTATATPAPTCPAGTADCGGACVDPQTDATNCGACGNVCASGLSCRRGVCAVVRDHRCPPGSANCNGSCLDTTTDPNNCGGCGVVCGGGQTCVGGQCAVVRDHRCAPLTNCNDACVDLATDPANCGACGAACAGDEICFAGACARDHRT